MMNTSAKVIDKTLIILAGSGFVFFGTHVSALDAPSPAEIESISANWECKWCPYPDKAESRGAVTAGAGYVSNDSYRQGDYTGRDEKGAYLIGGLEYDYRAPGQTHMNVEGSELGTDARDLSVKGRSGGQLSGGFSYSELPHLVADTGRTPYRGGASQQLPAGWVDGATTQDMTQLSSALRDVDIYTQRKTIKLNASYQQSAVLSYDVVFQRDNKEGKRTAGLAIGSLFATANSVILAIPVDYETNQGEVKVNYVGQQWQASVAYQFSSFDNSHRAVQWENAYSTAATAGQAALEPDNTMQRIALKGAYQFTSKMFANLLLAYGHMEQNQSYLPYDINSVATSSLPVNSLNGKINTYDAAANFHLILSDQLRLQATVRHNEQDNDTRRESYDYVIADTPPPGPAPSRDNMPYSFRKSDFQVSGRYRIPQHVIQASVEHEIFDRTYQSVDSTQENTLRLSYRTDMVNNLDIQLRGATSGRDGDKYQPVSDLAPADNPLLRKYNLADRDRDQLGAALTYNPQTNWHLTAYLDAYKDRYSNSEIGLLESIQEDYGVGLHYRVSKEVTFNIDYSLTDIESTQAGSDSFSTANWYAVNEDQIDVIDFRVSYDVIPEVFNLRFEYSYAESEGKIRVSTGGPLPLLSSTRHSYLLQGDYRISERSVISAFYRYEDYEESDWAIDDVNPDTITRVLSLGEISPDYQIGIIGAAIRYQF